jgi:hypothetical protein
MVKQRGHFPLYLTVEHTGYSCAVVQLCCDSVLCECVVTACCVVVELRGGPPML